jgi:hypothetical protein
MTEQLQNSCLIFESRELSGKKNGAPVNDAMISSQNFSRKREAVSLFFLCKSWW